MRAAVNLALALALAGAGCGEPNGDAGWVPVAREDLVLEVDVTGVLRASRASPIGAPQVPDMSDFKIVRMASEGTEVKRGQTVLTFDGSELERQLAERVSERDAVDQEIVKKKIDLDLARREGEMRVAEAEATLRRAELKADLPPQYTAAIEVKLAKIDLDSAHAELDGARKRLSFQLKLGTAELAFLRDRRARANARVERIQEAIKLLEVASPVEGLVVNEPNWRGERKRVGESCWAGDDCLEVVDVSQMLGKGQVEETESARVRVGQPVVLRLEALPEMEWNATITAMRPTVFRQSPRTPLKVIGVDLTLERTDPVRMRPGMQFRGQIETGRAPRALLVPLDAVFIRPDGPIAFRRTAGVGGFEAVKVRLGKRNGRYAEVLAGLNEGDRVARRDLEQEGASR